jgi:inactivated superfamily I helicase
MSNEQDRHDVANLLLQSGADLGVGDGRLVLLAIQHGKYTLLQEACEAAPGPVIVSGAALQAAQAADDRQAFISLLPLTDLSQMDVDAALVFAAKHVCIQEVERLLNWGADADTNSGAPLSLAIQQQSATLAALLLQHGAQPSGSQVQGLLAFAGPDLLNVLEASNIMPRTVARLAS